MEKIRAILHARNEQVTSEGAPSNADDGYQRTSDGAEVEDVYQRTTEGVEVTQRSKVQGTEGKCENKVQK